MSPAALIVHQEAGRLLRSTRGLAWLLTLACALSGFGLLLVGSTELSLLDNAQVLYAMLGIVTALGAVLAVVMGADGLAGERERGSLLPLLLTPLSRGGLLAGKLGGQAVCWAAMLALAVPYLWAVGGTEQSLVEGGLVLILLGTPVVLGFGLLALGVGARLGSSRATLLVCLAALLAFASPALLGPSLHHSALGRAFAAINPFSAALNAYDAVVLDRQGAAAQAAHAAVAALWLAATLAFAADGVRKLPFGKPHPRSILLAALLAAAPGLALPSAAPAAAAPSELRVEVSPAPDNPARPKMGDRVVFRSTIRNVGAVPAEAVIAWLSLVQIDRGQEQPVDLEDWSAYKAITVPRLEPGEAVHTPWPIRLIQAGHYRLTVSAATRAGAAPATSPFADLTIRAKPVVQSARVLPVALGVPALLLGGLLRRRRRQLGVAG